MVKIIFQYIKNMIKKARIRKKTKWLCSWVFSPEFEEDMNAVCEDFTEEELTEESMSKKELPNFDVKKSWKEFEKYYLPLAEEYKIKTLKEEKRKFNKFQKQVKKFQKRKSPRKFLK